MASGEELLSLITGEAEQWRAERKGYNMISYSVYQGVLRIVAMPDDPKAGMETYKFRLISES